MRIQYRIRDGYAEIVRCFGTGETVVVPEKIGEITVRAVAAYTFSDKKSSEDQDVLEYRTEDGFLEEDREQLLAGEKIAEVVFPETVQEIGNYIFYGCRKLKKLTFSDRLYRIGSGAFTGCGKLRELNVFLMDGEKSCVKEILGELWQRIDVTFYRNYVKTVDRQDANLQNIDPQIVNRQSTDRETEIVKLVFPEHYEEAVENTPARILFTQHHGTGNNYRQCFYSRELDYRKYDELFVLAEAQEPREVLEDLVFWRMKYPYGLSGRARKNYETYLSGQLGEIVEHLIKTDRIDRLGQISAYGLWKEDVLEAAAVSAADLGKAEIAGFLMNERQRLFPKKTGAKKRKFEL